MAVVRDGARQDVFDGCVRFRRNGPPPGERRAQAQRNRPALPEGGKPADQPFTDLLAFIARDGERAGLGQQHAVIAHRLGNAREAPAALVAVMDQQLRDIGQAFEVLEEFWRRGIVHAPLGQEMQRRRAPVGLLEGAHLVQAVRDRLRARALLELRRLDLAIGAHIGGQDLVEEFARIDPGERAFLEGGDDIALGAAVEDRADLAQQIVEGGAAEGRLMLGPAFGIAGRLAGGKPRALEQFGLDDVVRAGLLAACVQHTEHLEALVLVVDDHAHERAALHDDFGQRAPLFGLHLAEFLVEGGSVGHHARLALALAGVCVEFHRRAGPLDRVAEERTILVVQRDAPVGAFAENRAGLIGDQRMQRARPVLVRLKVTQDAQKDGERGQPLLAIDDFQHARLFAMHENDGADEVRNLGVGGFLQVAEQVDRFGLAPGIAALVRGHPQPLARRKHIAQ